MKKYIITTLLMSSYFAQAEIKQSLGVDPSVNYPALEKLGPWDDRNYQLTKEDLDMLPEDDQYLGNVPLFYKVQARKDFPHYGKFYPRSLLQKFQIEYGGLLVDGIWHKEGLGIGYHRDSDSYGQPSETAIQASAANETPLETGVSGNEVSIECNPTNANNCVAGSNGSGGQRMYYSTDAGVSWTLSQINASSCCDPTIDWSSDGTIVYQADLASNTAIRWSRSLDQGVTWEPMQSQTAGGRDKEMIHVDRAPGSAHKDNVYLTWHNGNVMKFSRSTDMGVTMENTISFDSEETGIGSDITTGLNGEVYYIYPSLGAGISPEIRLLKSTDGGVTFAPGIQIAPLNGRFDFPIPAMESREVFIYNSADVDTTTGDIYVAWTDEADDSAGGASGGANANHAWIQVSKSTDQGATWTSCAIPHDSSDTIGGTPIDRFHPWIKVGENGVVHIGYYDTRHSVNRTGVDFYYTASLDGCATWEPEERYTTVTSTNIANGQEWGDYNGLSVVLDKIATSFTDNRPGAGQTAMIATGENMFSAPSFLLDANPTELSVCANQSGINSTVSVLALQDYNNDVAFSLDSAPAFVVNDSFSPAIVTSPGDTTFTFDVDGTGTTGNHIITLKGIGNSTVKGDPAIERTIDLNLSYSASVSGSTALSNPVNNDVNVAIDTTFTWAIDANAISYHLMVSDDPLFSSLIVDEIVSGTSFDATGLPSATVLYWKVATMSGCNVSNVESAVYSFSTIALPGDCAIGFVPVESNLYDFETDEQGWTHSAISGSDAWSLSTSNPNSGLQSFNAAQINDSDSVLVSPSFTLPIGQDPLTLQFWNAQSMEDRTDACFDGGLIEISTDNGDTFSPIPASAMFSDPYDGPVTGLDGAEGWCGDPQAYLNSIVDINSYAGQTVQFRFRMGNDGSVTREEGWHIDDVRVVGCQVEQAFNITAVDSSIEVCENDTAVGTTINVNTDNVFNGQVTLSNTTTPSFISNIDFSNNPLAMTPGTSALTFDVGLGMVGSHLLTIQGNGNDGSPVMDTTNIEIIYSNNSNATTLTAPLDASTDVPLSTTFTWDSDANASSYHLVVATDAGFKSIIIDETVTENSYDATGLPGNATLYWRVDTQSSCNDNDVESTVFSFTTSEVYCATVPVAIPDNLQAGIDITLTVNDDTILSNLLPSIKSDHTWPGDLIFNLSHNGTIVEIMNRPGSPATTNGCSQDGVDVIFDDNSKIPVEDTCEDPGGIFGTLSPDNPLSTFAGQTFSGDWVLNVSDNANIDTGSITEFCLTPVLQEDLIYRNGFEVPTP